MAVFKTDAMVCPNCGGPLEPAEAEGFYKCPYCRSTIRVTFLPPDPGARPDGRSVIRDKNTGVELAYGMLPRGFAAEGYLVQERQSPGMPYTLYLHAVSKEGDAALSWRTGMAYKEILLGGQHVEGGIDPLDKSPLRRRVPSDRIADEFMIANKAQDTELKLLETRDYPVFPTLDRAARSRELYEGTERLLRANTPVGMTSAVENADYDACTRIYSHVRPDGREVTQAVAAAVGSVRIFGGAPMMAMFGGGVRFISWTVDSIASYRTFSSGFQAGYEDFVCFCSTLELTPYFADLTGRESQRIYGELHQQQWDSFNAHQRRMQSQQAAFDAYNQAWRARSNSMFEARRASYAARQSSEDRISDMRSEAIRGVDTYVRPDGTEVEYSVVNEAAFASVNNSRVTFATEAKAFESADWVQMKKKY